jgi:hypothetical protein
LIAAGALRRGVGARERLGDHDDDLFGACRRRRNTGYPSDDRIRPMITVADSVAGVM